MASLFPKEPDGFYGNYLGDDGNEYVVIKKTTVIVSSYRTFDGNRKAKRERSELFTLDGQDVTTWSGDKLKIVETDVVLTPKP